MRESSCTVLFGGTKLVPAITGEWFGDGGAGSFGPRSNSRLGRPNLEDRPRLHAAKVT
jgi:hypothetical protein